MHPCQWRLCAGGPCEINARSAEDRCGAVLSSGQAVGTEQERQERRLTWCVVGGIDALNVDTVGACVRTRHRRSVGACWNVHPRLMFVSTIINRLSGLATVPPVRCGLCHMHTSHSRHTEGFADCPAASSLRAVQLLCSVCLCAIRLYFTQ